MSTQTRRLAIAACVILYAGILVRSAWLMDDAYITFRVSDNLVHGFGMRWNVEERAQAFTNPMWMLTLALFEKMTDDIFYTPHVLQIVLSLATVFLVAWAARSAIAGVLGVLVLALSKAFVDYSTSGLENALSHFLLTAFCLVYFRDGKGRDLRRLFVLCLLAAFGLTNRLDLGWLYAPCLLEAAFRTVRQVRARGASYRWPRVARGVLLAGVLGMVPIIAWELVSLFYFGALLPNSALAKLNTGLGAGILAWHGLYYYFNSFKIDPVTVPAIVLGIVAAAQLGNARQRVFAFGLVLNLFYILRVGGDHMAGRFFSVPVLASVLILTDIVFAEPARVWSVIAGFALLLGWIGAFPSLNGQSYALVGGATDGPGDIDDDFRQWWASTGLISRWVSHRRPEHDWIEAGKRFAEHPGKVEVTGGVGCTGFFGGPKVRILDEYALTDPLRARLPMPNASFERVFKVGHFGRPIPPGYIASLEHDENDIKNPDLAAYYERLRFVTRGPLWSWRRLRMTMNLVSGRYDHFLKAYLVEYEQKPIGIDAVPPAAAAGDGGEKKEGYSFRACGGEVGCVFVDGGLRLELHGLSDASKVEVELSGGDYDVEYRKDFRVEGRATIHVPGGATREGRVTLDVPEDVRHATFDAVSFVPHEKTGLRKITFAQLK